MEETSEGNGAVNLTVKKLLEDDKSLNLEDALQHALWARNMEIGRLGRSPYQIVLGKSPALPGLTDGNVVTDSIITESDAVRLHFDRQEKVRVLYRQADANRRLKDAEKARVQPYNDQKYSPGDLIMFLDKEDQWNGPGEVQGTESQTIFVTHNGNLKKVASCRSRPWFVDSDEEEKSKYVNDGESSDEHEIIDISNDVIENAGVAEADKGVDTSSEDSNQSSRRPKLYSHVQYKLRNDHKSVTGKIVNVGKKNTKNKDKCWIEKDDSKDVVVVDFLRDVETWKTLKKVCFDNTEDPEITTKGIL